MNNLEKKEYTAEEACEILEMKYSSVIYLFRKNKIKKIDRKYIITDEELENLKNRKNQKMKLYSLDENYN